MKFLTEIKDLFWVFRLKIKLIGNLIGITHEKGSLPIKFGGIYPCDKSSVFKISYNLHIEQEAFYHSILMMTSGISMRSE